MATEQNVIYRLYVAYRSCVKKKLHAKLAIRTIPIAKPNTRKKIEASQLGFGFSMFDKLSCAQLND